MSGILEQILANQEAMLTKLNAISAAMGKTPTVTLESTASSAEEPGTITQTESKGDASVADQSTGELELDSDGVPWDERIHSGSKKRNKGGKGPWQKRKGISDADYKRITAELQAKYADGTNETATTDAPAAPPSPGTPSVPGVPAAGNPPPPPATGTAQTPPPPAVSDPGEAARKAATDAVNKLTKERGVILDVIEQYYSETHGVDNFSMLTADKYEQVAEDISDWAARVQTAQGTVNAIKRIYEANVAVIEPSIKELIGQFQYISGGQAEVCESVEQVPYSMLSDLNQRLNDFYAACKKSAGL